MSPSLQTRWQVQQIAREPIATIRARELQYTIQGPQDAWGRQGRPQPLLVSAEVSLTQPFGASSSKDIVASDTVHYGLLSKAVLATLARLDQTGEVKSMSLHGVLESIWSDLTGLRLDGAEADLSGRKVFLSLQYVRSLTVTLHLPKATLLGGGVSLSATSVLETALSTTSVKATAMTLSLKELRIPTLIGVNDNERTAKQVVVANIGIEKYYNQQDAYAPLEALVTDLLSSSSYETLEALASDLTVKISQHLKSTFPDSAPVDGWRITIGLEKPIAVTLADAACVELQTNTSDVSTAT